MRRPVEPVFLARQSYRRRRLGDAARLFPIVGLVMFLLPLLWAGEARTSGGLIYVFAVWAGLIFVISRVSRRLIESEPGREDEEPRPAVPPRED